MTNFVPVKMATTGILIKGKGLSTVLALVIVIVFLLACKDKRPQENVMSKPEFAALLTEFYMAEARLNHTAISKDSAMKLFLPFEEKFLAKHNISDSLLRTTYKYYIEHPLELQSVYDAVIDTLSLREHKKGIDAVRL